MRLRRDGGGLSRCRSNLAHKWHCLRAVSPVNAQWWNNPLILCYLSGRSWVLTEAPNPLWLAEHILSWGGGGTRADTPVWVGGGGTNCQATSLRRCPKYTWLSTHVNHIPSSFRCQSLEKNVLCSASSHVKTASSFPFLTFNYSSSTRCLSEWQLQWQWEWGQLHRAAPSGLPGPSHLLHALLLLALGHRCLLLLSQGKGPETSSLSLTLIALHSI